MQVVPHQAPTLIERLAHELEPPAESLHSPSLVFDASMETQVQSGVALGRSSKQSNRPSVMAYCQALRRLPRDAADVLLNSTASSDICSL